MFTYFNHRQLQRYLLAFGSFFNNIQIRRDDALGNETQRMVVPIEYGPKERWLARLVQDPDFTKGVGVVVPRMAFELSSLNYDSSRKLNSINTLNYRLPNSDSGHLQRLYVGVPWNLTLNLDILTKLQQDGLQIVEQILPYFTPDLTFKLRPIPELGLTDQIPLTLTSCTQVDNFDGDFEHRRAIVWSLGFSMRVNFWGPVATQARIQEVLIDIHNAPLSDIMGEPVILETEDGHLFELEDGSGHIVGESTPDAYLQTTPTAVIDAVALPNQDPLTSNVQATVTVTEHI